MPYRAPVKDFQFLMDEVAGFPAVAATHPFADATSDTVTAILTEAAKLAQEVIAPLQRQGDLHPAVLENGVVRTSPGFAGGYRAIADGGWVGVGGDLQGVGAGAAVVALPAAGITTSEAVVGRAVAVVATPGDRADHELAAEVDTLIEALGDPHGHGRRQAQFARRFLLQG